MTTVEFNLYTTGYCRVPQAAALRGGRWRAANFHALFAVIHHPQHGIILFDTGYSAAFHTATRPFPERLYAWITPVYRVRSAADQLRELRIDPDAVRAVIISHFHADHICGLADFPNAAYIYAPAAYTVIRSLSRWRGVRQAFLAALIPADFEARAQPLAAPKPLPDAYAPFTHGTDLYHDRSLIAVDLSGHAPGQIGLFVRTAHQTVLLAADACWYSQDYRKNQMPPRLGQSAIADKAAYRATLNRLHHFHQQHPAIPILPAHCPEVFAQWVR